MREVLAGRVSCVDVVCLRKLTRAGAHGGVLDVEEGLSVGHGGRDGELTGEVGKKR